LFRFTGGLRGLRISWLIVGIRSFQSLSASEPPKFPVLDPANQGRSNYTIKGAKGFAPNAKPLNLQNIQGHRKNHPADNQTPGGLKPNFNKSH